MSRLRECPFCGGQPELYESEPSTARFNEGSVHFAIQCLGLNCGHGAKAHTWLSSPEEAISAWNGEDTCIKLFDISEHEFYDCCVRFESINKHLLCLSASNGYPEINKQDAIAIAKALGVTGEDLL